MCDYSLKHLASRPAKVGDKLTTKNFGLGTRGFCSPEDPGTPVCVLPGTELAFSGPVHIFGDELARPAMAIFRQIHKDDPHRHHDALEFENGDFVLLTFLQEDQRATVLQLPAEPKNAVEAEEQRRVDVVA